MKRLVLLLLSGIFIPISQIRAVDFSDKGKSITYTNAIKVLENYQTIINRMGEFIVNHK